MTGGDSSHIVLADEAIWLAQVVVAALPEQAEALGLLSLMRYCHARRATRHSADSRYVPLDEQQHEAWDQNAIADAERLLVRAARLLAPGRYQTEAAIQSLHVARRRGHPVAPDTLLTLYDALWAFAPTIGVAVNRAAVMAQAGQLLDALAHIDELPSDVVRTYQPWWALRAHVLALLGRRYEAAAAYDTTSGLTESPSVRAFLLGRRAALSVGTH